MLESRLFLVLLIVLSLSSCNREEGINKDCDLVSLIEGWTVESFEIPNGVLVRDIYFATETTGFAVGFNGEIIKTANDGVSWTRLNSGSSLNLRTVNFVDENTGFAAGAERTTGLGEEVGLGSLFLRTTDGGKSWERIYSKRFDFMDLHFFSAQKGIAIVGVSNRPDSNSNRIALSEDAGDTWQLQDFTVDPINHQFLVISNRVVVRGKDRNLYLSDDEANSWVVTNNPSPVHDIRDLKLITKDIWFIDNGYSVFKTENGGNDWLELDVPFPEFELSHFNSESEGFMIRSHMAYTGGDFPDWKGNSVYQTKDGGITWTQSKIWEECRLTGHHHFPTDYRGYSIIPNKVYRFSQK